MKILINSALTNFHVEHNLCSCLGDKTGELCGNIYVYIPFSKRPSVYTKSFIHSLCDFKQMAQTV